jgi:hypothetical protein
MSSANHWLGNSRPSGFSRSADRWPGVLTHDRKCHGHFFLRKLHAQLHAGLAREGATVVAIETGPAPKRNESPPIVVCHALQPPGDLGASGFHSAWEETGVAGVKLIWNGMVVTDIRDHHAIAGTFPGNYTSERLEAVSIL